MGMNVNLTPQLEEMVRQKVNSGLYSSASEVVREALRLMDEQDRMRAAKLEQLRQDIRAGLDSGVSTAWDPEQVKRDGRARRLRHARRRHRMPRIVRRPWAGAVIADIWDYVAEDSAGQPDAWVDRLDAKLRLLSTQPMMGRTRNELSLGLRSIPFGRYVIFYEALPDGIDVVRIPHSARDVDAAFEDDSSGT